MARKTSSQSKPSRPTPHPVSRRHFLGGSAAMIGLPMLDSLQSTSSTGKRGQGTPPKRLLCYYVPNGIHMASWTPSQTGSDYQLPPILAPLENDQANIHLRNDVLVISGLQNLPARPEGPGDHAAGTGGFLTCTHINKSETDIRNNISFDQVYANAQVDAPKLPSLQLGVEGGSNQGNCDSGYGCAYSRNISWAGPTSPLPKLTSPKVAFDLMFGGSDPKETAEEIARRKHYRMSILDYLRSDTKSLQTQLGMSDRMKLDEYLTGVRELEKRIDSEESNQCDTSSFQGSFSDYPEHVAVMTDLMVLALQCDATRIISFMLGNAGSRQNYQFLGIPDAHHDLSHHGNNPETFPKLETIDIWEMEQFARLLHKMKAVQEGDGTMLDNSIVFFSSEIEDGNSHSHRNLPVIVAGRGGGQIRSGRHFIANEEPISDLFITLLQVLGVNVQSFGDDGTKALAGIV